MKATFKFSNIESTIPVNEFNSLKAAMAWTKPEYGVCTLEFDTDELQWINEPTEQRERAARSRWLDDCYRVKTTHNEKVTGTPGKLDRGVKLVYPPAFTCIVHRVHEMGKTFEVPMNDKPTDVGHQRLDQFIKIICDEVRELRDAVSRYPEEDGLNVDLVQVADCLGDLVVYVLSEANRWGIPIVSVLHAILDSQNSKLVDGKPLWNGERTKFIKGPNYVAPEPEIRRILETL